jgi:mycothiol synthase
MRPTELNATAAPLPEGYTARPATQADVAAVVAMLNAGTQALLGRDEHSVNEWAVEWRGLGNGLAENTRLVLAPNGETVGYMGLWDRAPHTRPEQFGGVAPAHTGRGLGTHLAQWAELRARQLMAAAAPSAGVTLQAWINGLDRPAAKLLADNGYAWQRSYIRMVIDLEAVPPAAPEWPEGIGVRNFVPGQDDRATLKAINGAFQDSRGYIERPFEEHLADWSARTLNNPEFDPSLWFLATAGEEVIGTVFTRLHTPEDPEAAWLFTLGVTRPWRKRGVAQALLLHAFGEMRRRGRRRVILGVDSGSPTNAVHLYEKAGMQRVPKGTEEVWEKELRAASRERET